MTRNRWLLSTAFGLALLLCAGLLLTWQGLTPTAAFAQAESGITSPSAGETLSGVVTILGTATAASFDRYELHYKPSEAGDNAYIYLSGAGDEVIDAQLGFWDVTNLQPGAYDLRLRVVQVDANYTEYVVTGLSVAGAQAEPTATLTDVATVEATEVATEPATVEPEATITPTVATDDATDVPDGVAQIIVEGNMNVRAGPGTNYAVVGTLQAGTSALITGRNEAGDWWQIEIDGGAGWVLASLVTAQNADAVPVVATPAPPPTPTATIAPAATVTPTAAVAPTAVVTSPAVVTVTAETGSAVSPSSSGLVTVTLVGDDDIGALTTFLRVLLASFSAENTTVTAFIGELPADLPLDITVPDSAAVLGGVVSTAEFGGAQLYLTTQGGGDDLVAELGGQLEDAGFTAPLQDRAGLGEVFLSSSQLAPPSVFCGPDDDLAVTIGTVALAGEAEVVTISTNQVTGFGGLCAPVPAGDTTVIGILPSLTAPAQSQVVSGGSSSGGGGASFMVAASAEIESALPIGDLAAHYTAQLEDAGWTSLGESETDSLAWSAWSFTDDDGNDWNGTFYIVQQGGEVGSYLANLRAETGP